MSENYYFVQDYVFANQTVIHVYELYVYVFDII